MSDSAVLDGPDRLARFSQIHGSGGSSALMPDARGKYLLVTHNLGAMEGFALVGTYDAVSSLLHVQR